MRAVGRYAYPVTVLALLFGIVAVGTFLVVTAGPDLVRFALAPAPTASPTASAAATPDSAMAISPIGIEMPVGSDCESCHITDTGTLGTKPIPVMAHPLFGWRDCTACHATDSLVQTAPGHTTLHKDDCLVCHQTRTVAGEDSPPPLRPEHMGTDKPCIACHGVDEHAPLPASMAGRENCWICHNGEEFTYLFEEGATDPPADDGDGDDGASGDPGDPSAEPSDGTGYRLRGDTIR